MKARSVKGTLTDLKRGVLAVDELPKITVLDTGQLREDGRHEMISLNNRRLWVLKQCKAAGILRWTFLSHTQMHVSGSAAHVLQAPDACLLQRRRVPRCPRWRVA